MRVTTIARNAQHSPNLADSDTAILQAVENELRKRGAYVEHTEEEQALPDRADCICHMSRTGEVLEKIRKAEEKGTRALNTAGAVKNTERERFTALLAEAGIVQPPFTIATSDVLPDNLEYPLWIKKGEGWSCCKNDICYAKDAGQAEKARAEMQGRGIRSIIYSKHINGDIIKFYGVGEEFFHFLYPDPEKSKFGLEKINGTQHRYPFDKEKLREIALRATEATGLVIFGGDCIVTEKGEILIIDINDFPSFSVVREEAAKAIATLIMGTDKKQEE